MNRRHFLKTTAVGLGATLAPTVARAQEPIKIGVLLPFSKAFLKCAAVCWPYAKLKAHT